MKAFVEEPKVALGERKPRVIYPAGYSADPVEWRRIAKELRGSIPDIMTQEELQQLRQKS